MENDHTFKASANVGYWEHKVWKKMFDSLFIVMNEKSEILGWQLTKGTSLDKVKGLLQGLKLRLAESSLEGCVVDNCCTVRKKLQGIFGESINVKLDIFHAIQRIVQKIPKRSGSVLENTRRTLLKDLTLCFRQQDDIGSTRKKPTPCPKAMESNIVKFIAKWRTQLVGEERVFPDAAIKEAETLINLHVNKGCLSHFPAGIGTNGNESLHKKIRKWMKKNRVGICLAVALLSFIFYLHMQSKPHDGKCKRGMKVIAPVSEWFKNHMENGGVMTGVRFGICGVSKQLDKQLLEANCDSEDGLPNYDSCPSDDDEISDTSDDEIISANDIINITKRAEVMKAITETIFEKSKAPIKSDKRVWINSHAILSRFTSVSARSSDSVYDKLDGILENYGFTRIPISGDGNCCFASISYGLEQFLLGDSNSSLCEHLHGLKLSAGQSTDHRISLLRSLVVQEWLGDDSGEYIGFLTNSEQSLYKDIAKNFLEPGYFDCELGNSVPLALSNILRCPIILFTTICDCPVLPLVPRLNALSAVPIYVAYNQSCSGHYDAVATWNMTKSSEEALNVVPKMESKPSEDTPPCSCGRGHSTNKDKMFCNEFKSRCKCFQQLTGCGNNCKCFNCANPHGKRKPQVSMMEGQRKRRKHDQTPKTSREYMEQKEVNQPSKTGQIMNVLYYSKLLI